MAIVSIATDPKEDWAQGRNGLIKMATAEFLISGYRHPPKLTIDVLNSRGQVCNAGLGLVLTPEVVAGLKQVVEAAEAALKES